MYNILILNNLNLFFCLKSTKPFHIFKLAGKINESRPEICLEKQFNCF